MSLRVAFQQWLEGLPWCNKTILNEEVAAEDPPRAARDLAGALRAVGAHPVDALGQVAQACGEASAWPMLREMCGDPLPCRLAVGVLNDVAKSAPATANVWLARMFLEGLVVPDVDHAGARHFTLQGLPWLTDLPEGMHLDGNVVVSGCHGFRSLPRAMHAEGYVCLRDCPAWDGEVPDAGGMLRLASFRGAVVITFDARFGVGPHTATLGG